MIVRKTNNSIILELENEKSFYELIETDALFWNDLYFYHSSQDGWQYLYDANQDKVYPIDDYQFNRFNDLLSEGHTEIKSVPNDDTYSDYEWNIKED